MAGLLTRSIAKDSIIVRLMIHAIVACLTIISLAGTAAGSYCSACHRPAGRQPHARFGCNVCHLVAGVPFSDPADRSHGASGCVQCHRGYERLFSLPMGSRSGEQAFVDRTYGRHDMQFFAKNCNSCHLRGCGACHGSGHALQRPATVPCLACHKGYFTGWDYLGRAPREDNSRYQRGAKAEGETFLRMLPDVHFAAGIPCAGCHTMQSLLAGRKSAKGCRDCHEPDLKVPEHRIRGHMTRLECQACHAAWSAQEYGTFFLRFVDQALREEFDLKPGENSEYLRSGYLKKQDLPPLGLNSSGRVSPVRPEFIAFYTDINAARRGGAENIMLAAEWRAFSPHSIQRGTANCAACHENPRRWLAEPTDERIYLLRKDGLPLDSFWDRTGQQVVNGGFFPMERLQETGKGNRHYIRGSLEKWRSFLKQDGRSSQK
jgi:hypothetical protein